jgi:hypothetical protein
MHGDDVVPVLRPNNRGPLIWMSFNTYYFIGGNNKIKYLIAFNFEEKKVFKYVDYFFLESNIIEN